MTLQCHSEDSYMHLTSIGSAIQLPSPIKLKKKKTQPRLLICVFYDFILQLTIVNCQWLCHILKKLVVYTSPSLNKLRDCDKENGFQLINTFFQKKLINTFSHYNFQRGKIEQRFGTVTQKRSKKKKGSLNYIKTFAQEFQFPS